MDRPPEPILSPIQRLVELPDKYKCVQCHNPLYRPVQTRCGHRFCSDLCLNQLFKLSELPKCPAGQDDCVFLMRNEVHPDTDAEKEMQQLLVRCPYKEYGCQESVVWKNLDAHVASCKYAEEKCPNKPCSRSLQREKLQQHSQQECQHTEASCPDCKKPVARAFHADHMKSGCREAKVSCGICEKAIPRKEIEQHKQTCLSESSPQERELQNINYKKSEENAEIQSQQQITEGEPSTIADSRTTAFEAKLVIESLVEKMTAELQRQQQRNTEELTSLVEQLKVNQEVGREEQEEHSRQLSVLHQRLDHHDDKLEKVVSSAINNATSQDGLEKDFSVMDLRVQCLEMPTDNGKLIWEISDYRRRKIQNMTMDSQPFYTSRNGYKMCVRLYLNGNGDGKGTHLSLYLVIMKGDNDASLQWPFEGKVTFALMDLERRSESKQVSETFHTDPTSRSFRRPRGEANAAYGPQLFALHSVVENDTYLRNDTIFIKGVVEPYQDRV